EDDDELSHDGGEDELVWRADCGVSVSGDARGHVEASPEGGAPDQSNPRAESRRYPPAIPSRLRGRDERSAEGAGGHGVVRGGSRRGQPAALGWHGPGDRSPRRG